MIKPHRRTLIVLGALIGGMTLVSAVLLLLEPRPVTPESQIGPLRHFGDSGDPAAELFETSPAPDPHRWKAIVIHHSGTSEGSARSIHRVHERLDLGGGLGIPYTRSNEAPPLPSEARYAVLEGDFRLRQEQGAWTFRAEDLVLGSARPGPSRSRVVGSWQGKPITRFALGLEIDDLDVAILRELNEDARRSYRELARALGVSISTVSTLTLRLPSPPGGSPTTENPNRDVYQPERGYRGSLAWRMAVPETVVAAMNPAGSCWAGAPAPVIQPSLSAAKSHRLIGAGPEGAGGHTFTSPR